jgi:hypothetical protein
MSDNSKNIFDWYKFDFIRMRHFMKIEKYWSLTEKHKQHKLRVVELYILRGDWERGV